MSVTLLGFCKVRLPLETGPTISGNDLQATSYCIMLLRATTDDPKHYYFQSCRFYPQLPWPKNKHPVST